MQLVVILKKALFISAFFIAYSTESLGTELVASQPLQVANCELVGAPDQMVKVAAVHDGDTVRLEDGRSVRLIGINTPELARKGRPAEDYALQAKQALQVILAEDQVQGHKVGLRYGKAEDKDRYGRVLAHLYLPDGRNIQAMMLRQGAAMAISVPPNLSRQACYFKAEKQARHNDAGLWARAAHQAQDAANLNAESKGFVWVQGIVARVSESRKSVWLNLSGMDEDKLGADSYEGLLGVRIARHDLHYFDGGEEKGHFDDLLGKAVLLRGWVYPYRDQPVIRLRHPSSLEILEN